jgi:hypothetical protein
MFERLPFELLNEIYSFVGKHKTAELIEKLVDDIDDIYIDFVGCRNEPLIKETEEFSEKVFEIININKEYGRVGRPKYIFDHNEVRFNMLNEIYNCYYCNKIINRTELLCYGARCTKCYSRKLGCEEIEEEEFIESDIDF